MANRSNQRRRRRDATPPTPTLTLTEIEASHHADDHRAFILKSCFNGTSMRWYELSHHPTRSNPRSSPSSSEFSTENRSYKQVIEASRIDRSFHGFDLDPVEWSKPELDGPQISQAAADAFVRYKIGVKQGVR
ncbi:BnaA06g16490D [Brassica napus]|uniref:BnaA06g16490D protein n=1 Tax=Brassica napus TaxID=3708 RepID=A0A078F4T5_BRANA|nr:BnaA06g16490D [Brassica napus]